MCHGNEAKVSEAFSEKLTQKSPSIEQIDAPEQTSQLYLLKLPGKRNLKLCLTSHLNREAQNHIAVGMQLPHPSANRYVTFADQRVEYFTS
jgi:hypothetical protein